jgi:hypothetical protein
MGISTVAISKAEIAKQLAHIDGQTTDDAKGKAFEALVDYLFTCLGCRTKRNITSPLHGEQLDLVGVHLGALNPLPTFFIIECKYWENKVDSKAVGYFINTCRSRKAKLAIIFAKKGLSGSKAKHTAAHSVAFGASPEGIHLVLVTLNDIQSLGSNEDFANLMIDAWILAAAGAGVGMT